VTGREIECWIQAHARIEPVIARRAWREGGTRMALATRKYRAFMGGLVFYVFLIAFVAYYIHVRPDSPWCLPLAFATVIPIAYTLQASIRYTDRFSRDQMRPQLRPGNFAFLCTLFLGVSLGVLEVGGLPRMSWLILAPIMVIFYALGRFLMEVRAKG
jgi:hypothetical protein